jgi:RNA polymerase sigma-70 factor, ECF subfamily
MTEQAAIRLAKRGDQRGFEALYVMHRQRVFAVCFYMLKDKELAEDLTQDTFVRLLRNIKGFRGQSKFSTWLHRVAVNEVLMKFRKNSWKYRTKTDSMEALQEDSHWDLEGRDHHTEKTLDRVALERCIEQLPDGYKTAFVLHDIHGYEHNEAAALMGWSSGNSKSQLHKARKRLRQLLTA